MTKMRFYCGKETSQCNGLVIQLKGGTSDEFPCTADVVSVSRYQCFVVVISLQTAINPVWDTLFISPHNRNSQSKVSSEPMCVITKENISQNRTR